MHDQRGGANAMRGRNFGKPILPDAGKRLDHRAEGARKCNSAHA